MCIRDRPLTARGHLSELVGDSLVVGAPAESTLSIAVADKYELSATTELRVSDSADMTVPNRLCSRCKHKLYATVYQQQ